MQEQDILVGLTLVAVALVSGNNLSACFGPAIGSRTVSQRSGALVGAAGFCLGLLVQGPMMMVSAQALLPNATVQLRMEALLVAILVFIAAYFVRVPIALTMSLVGLLAGLAIARSMTLNVTFVTGVIVMWLAAPAIAIISAFLFIRAVGKTHPKDIWRRLQTYKILLIVLSFASAYVLGANTLGLLVATGGFSQQTLLLAVPAILVGSFFLSAGEIRRVSQELYLMRYPNAMVALGTSTLLVEIATIFSIPLSNTQALSAAVFGTGVSYKNRLISLKPFALIVAGWVVAPLGSYVVGLVI
jgi:PiT family inorganic phosphate transporter